MSIPFARCPLPVADDPTIRCSFWPCVRLLYTEQACQRCSRMGQERYDVAW